MSTADEREDDIERLLHDGRVHRWARSRSAWPGHTTFVALKGGEVVVGDRYAAEGIERTYTCDPASLLEGCFQDLVAAQLGAKVLAELLREVRRELGAAEAIPLPASSRAAEAIPLPASSRVAEAIPLPASSRVAEAIPLPASSRVAEAIPAPATPPKPAASGEARVDVAVVACHRIGLPLAAALRAITRSPVKDLLARLQALPCRVASGLTREQAEGVAARLTGLGAEVQLLSEGT